MKIFNGKKEAEKILADLKKKIKREGKKPKLAVILVGENPASRLYVKLKKSAGEKIGLEVIEIKFKKNVLEKEIIKRIKEFNLDKSIQGIIVQLPLPSGFKTEKIIEAIDPKKDVDGFHPVNRALLKNGKPYFYPVLPLAILTALKKSGKNLKNKKILALVNSNIFGRVLSDFLKRNGLRIRYILFSELQGLFLRGGLRKGSPAFRQRQIKEADVLITVFSRPNFIKGSMIKKGAVLIDAGFIKRKGKSFGNIDKESVADKAAWLSPVPGGVGPLTVALLLRNVFLANGE